MRANLLTTFLSITCVVVIFPKFLSVSDLFLCVVKKRNLREKQQQQRDDDDITSRTSVGDGHREVLPGEVDVE
jgi:hypothetical protein